MQARVWRVFVLQCEWTGASHEERRVVRGAKRSRQSRIRKRARLPALGEGLRTDMSAIRSRAAQCQSRRLCWAAQAPETPSHRRQGAQGCSFALACRTRAAQNEKHRSMTSAKHSRTGCEELRRGVQRRQARTCDVRTCAMPSSSPGITCPAPSLKRNGRPRCLDESHILPSGRYAS